MSDRQAWYASVSASQVLSSSHTASASVPARTSLHRVFLSAVSSSCSVGDWSISSQGSSKVSARKLGLESGPPSLSGGAIVTRPSPAYPVTRGLSGNRGSASSGLVKRWADRVDKRWWIE